MPRSVSQSRSDGGKASPLTSALRSEPAPTPPCSARVEQDLQEARRAGITVRLQVGHRLQLQFGIAHPGREDGATDRLGAGLDHRGGRRQVVAETVVQQVAGTKAGGVQCAADAPVVGTPAFRFVDRAGRLKDPTRAGARAGTQTAPADRGQAAEDVASDARSRWRSSSSCLRSTGSRASAARLVIRGRIDRLEPGSRSRAPAPGPARSDVAARPADRAHAAADRAARAHRRAAAPRAHSSRSLQVASRFFRSAR